MDNPLLESLLQEIEIKQKSVSEKMEMLTSEKDKLQELHSTLITALSALKTPAPIVAPVLEKSAVAPKTEKLLLRSFPVYSESPFKAISYSDFCVSYAGYVSKEYKMSPPATKLFIYIMQHKNPTTVILSSKKVPEALKYKHLFYKGLLELLKLGFIARTESCYVFHVNSEVFFTGESFNVVDEDETI